MHATAIFLDALASYGLETGSNLREAPDHLAEVLAMNLYNLHVIESGTSRGTAALIGKQSNFAEVVSAGEIRKY